MDVTNFSANNKIKFSDLSTRNVFVSNYNFGNKYENYESSVFIKTDVYHGFNAVCVEDGVLCYFSPDDIVTLIDTGLIEFL